MYLELVRIGWKNSENRYIYDFVFQAISGGTLCNKDLTSYLKENNWNFNSYKFSYKFLIVTFFSFRINQKQQCFCNKKYYCFVFIVICALLQRHAKFNGLLQWNFLLCYSCSFIVSCFYFCIILLHIRPFTFVFNGDSLPPLVTVSVVVAFQLVQFVEKGKMFAVLTMLWIRGNIIIFSDMDKLKSISYILLCLSYLIYLSIYLSV